MPIYLQHGNLIDYVPPTDTSTEDVVFMGGLVGIPQTFIPAGELGALSVDGVYIFNKKEGVSVNLGEVVKYCGTTKLAQDSNADLTLGVAVADAETDDFGVKVKINSVLPTDGGGGGCGVTIDTSRGLSETSSGVGINIGAGLAFGCSGELNATGGGGGGSIGLTEYNSFIVTGEDNPDDPRDVVDIGYSTGSRSYGSVILGAYADNCSASSAVVIGSSAKVNNAQSGIAIGNYAEVAENGCGSVAIGLNAKSKSNTVGCGNIVIGSGINPYTDSALLVIRGNGSNDNSRRGVLFYAPSSDFRDVSGASTNGGIAFVNTQNNGDSWAISCNISF